MGNAMGSRCVMCQLTSAILALSSSLILAGSASTRARSFFKEWKDCNASCPRRSSWDFKSLSLIAAIGEWEGEGRNGEEERTSE